MKTIIFATLLLGNFSFAYGVHVNGYTKKDGTYVAPHERTAPDATKANNWSTQGNVNPYTGAEGIKKDNSTNDGYQKTNTWGN